MIRSNVEDKSSNVKTIGYDIETEVLEIVFQQSDTVYTFAGVPPCEYVDLAKADSIGSHFNRNIRNKYTFTFEKKDC